MSKSTLLWQRMMFIALPLVIATAIATEISFAQVWVRGYFRKDGTYVRPHLRSSPDGNPFNNYSFPGNLNPNTGKFSKGDVLGYLLRYSSRKLYPTRSGLGSSGSLRMGTFRHRVTKLPGYGDLSLLQNWLSSTYQSGRRAKSGAWNVYKPSKLNTWKAWEIQVLPLLWGSSRGKASSDHSLDCKNLFLDEMKVQPLLPLELEASWSDW